MEQLNTKQKVVIMLAIVSAMFFAAVNQTIVGTALPRIVADLGGVEYFNWVYTIFMLASSISGILVGKLSDIYGRKVFLLTGITIFLVGSFLCGWSNSIIQLIIFRALQGLGGGMIISTAHASVGDLFSPRERGKWQGFLASGFGLASVSGPTLGGFIVDSFNWNWVFWVFLPFGVISFVLIFWLLPQMAPKEKEPIDFLGSGTLTIVLISMLLTFSWGGVRYDWLSLEITALVVITFLSFLIFIKVERTVKSPVVPLDLFKNKVFTVSNMASFFTSAGMFGVMMYVPFFLQGVMGLSATASGFVIMPKMISMVISSTICGMIISRFGKYKMITLIGVFAIASGMLSISLMNAESSLVGIICSLIIMGLGMGAAFPVFTLIVQNAVEHKVLGVATSTAQLARHLGATVGVSIVGIVMNARLMQGFSSENVTELLVEIQDHNGEIEQQIAKLKDPQTLVDPKSVSEIQTSLPSELHELYGSIIIELRVILGYSISGALLTGTFVVFCGFIITLFLKETQLRTTIKQTPSKNTKETGTADPNL
ncbi:MDR family MFS transporter [Halalkalibacter krulwichiae]|uniref:Multidrug resistance protein 3 n=1 Tax=Halalkalibacter krulwichiae TaxID=199441 RepID=A0A1X9MBF1_9BACI|nr:MDR family MFS transporter [Halalkalibacter krulwichiae]ARK29920.1 Multidrug resistance protein 3 [Halalkalibacter krulwichiae]